MFREIDEIYLLGWIIETRIAEILQFNKCLNQ